MTQLPSEKPELFKGRHFNHLLIIQAVQWYVPAFEKKWKNYACPVGSSWRVDETYIKVKG